MIMFLLMLGDKLFDPMWEAVFRLENFGFTVLGICCDGLAANRRLFSLHKPGASSPVYKVINPHAHNGEKRYLYFLSDPPHLITTARNCLANEKRNLWVSLLFVYSLGLFFPLCMCSVMEWICAGDM